MTLIHGRPYKCPVCDGTGKVSRPPWVAGDQPTWSDTSAGPWPCATCTGSGITIVMPWISIKDQQPPTNEPVVYARPDTRRGKGHWHVGIAYWTVSQKWNPEAESQQTPIGFTYWIPLPDPPQNEDPMDAPWRH